MAKKNSIRDKLSRATYDKPKLQKTVIDIKKHLDEVNKFITTEKKK